MRSRAEDVLGKVSHFPLMNYAAQIDRILATDEDGTSQDTDLQLNAKMKHLQTLIYTHKINHAKYDAGRITKYTIKYLDHKSNDIKENAYLSLLRQYEVIGKDQDPYLHPMKPK